MNYFRVFTVALLFVNMSALQSAPHHLSANELSSFIDHYEQMLENPYSYNEGIAHLALMLHEGTVHQYSVLERQLLNAIKKGHAKLATYGHHPDHIACFQETCRLAVKSYRDQYSKDQLCYWHNELSHQQLKKEQHQALSTATKFVHNQSEQIASNGVLTPQSSRHNSSKATATTMMTSSVLPLTRSRATVRKPLQCARKKSEGRTKKAVTTTKKTKRVVKADVAVAAMPVSAAAVQQAEQSALAPSPTAPATATINGLPVIVMTPEAAQPITLEKKPASARKPRAPRKASAKTTVTKPRALSSRISVKKVS